MHVFALLPRLPYRQRVATLHGVNSDKEDHVSYWDYIDRLHRDSMLFYNFKYQLSDNTVSGVCITQQRSSDMGTSIRLKLSYHIQQ